MTGMQGFSAGCCVGAVAVAVVFTLRDALPSQSEPAEAPPTRNVYAETLVSAATWNDGPWPLTVDSAVLVCEGRPSDPYPFVRSPDGRLWPLNSAARELAFARSLMTDGMETDPAPLQGLGPSRNDPRIAVRLSLDGLKRHLRTE